MGGVGGHQVGFNDVSELVTGAAKIRPSLQVLERAADRDADWEAAD